MRCTWVEGGVRNESSSFRSMSTAEEDARVLVLPVPQLRAIWGSTLRGTCSSPLPSTSTTTPPCCVSVGTWQCVSQWLPGFLASVSRSSSPTSYLWEIAGFSQSEAVWKASLKSLDKALSGYRVPHAYAPSIMGRLSVQGSHVAGQVFRVYLGRMAHREHDS